MDLLSETLQTLHVRGADHFRSELAAPWGLQGPDGPAAYHAVLEGRCRLELRGGDGTVVWLDEGDVVMLPHGTAHALMDTEGRVTPPVETLLRANAPGADGVLRKAGSGPTTTLVCGMIEFDDIIRHPLLEALPDVITLRKDEQIDAPWLEHTLCFLACEATSYRAGASAMVGHLSSILFIQTIRAYLSRTPEGATGWLATLLDPSLGRALRSVHAAPGADWTVETMAMEAAMSRSGFAARFKDVMGEPPMQYVTRWRMYEAARLLRSGDAPLSRVADRVGYASEASFSRVFKRHTDETPGRFRKQWQEAA